MPHQLYKFQVLAKSNNIENINAKKQILTLMEGRAFARSSLRGSIGL